MNSPSPFEANFWFWGHRDYVQGSHIIYGLLEAVKYWNLGEMLSLSASFNQLLRKQGRFHLLVGPEGAAMEKSRFCALFTVSTSQGTFTAGLEEGQSLISQRIPDDEAALIANCSVDPDGMTATLQSYSGDRLFTVITAMNKKIHQLAFPSSGYSPWLLVRLDFHLADWAAPMDLLVKINRCIAKTMTKSNIFINGINTGDIFFKRQEL